MGQKSRWALPVVVDPPDRLCFRVEVPNDQNHIAAFLGAIYELSKPYSWQNDLSHAAVPTGAVWRAIFDQLEQQSCDDCAIPIAESDYDMSLCEQLRIGANGHLQALCCGVWEDIPGYGAGIGGIVTNPPAGGTVAVGACAEYDVVLSADNQWHSPVPVGGNFQITITAASGGWSDGTVSWNCPDGTPYVLGFCVGAGGLVGGDPLPTVNHMRLIAKIGATYYDAYNQTITLPGGTASSELILQANDSALPGNLGSITLHIKICNKNVATWTHTFDFANPSPNQHGWFIASPANGTLTWNVAGYWHSANALGHVGDGSGVVNAPNVGPFTVTAVQTTYGANNTSTVRNIIYSLGGVILHTTAMTNAAGAAVVTNDTYSNTIDALGVQLGADAIGKNCDLSKVVVTGTGTDPFIGY